jgi:murein DD-endopeptidase MepM/ murein hydrolase activator NlpD
MPRRVFPGTVFLSRRLAVHFLVMAGLVSALAGSVPAIEPLVRVVDLDVGESAEVLLHNWKSAKVQLLDLQETRDPIRQAVRRAVVKVLVNGKPVELEAGMYNLPVTVAGVQIDCTVTSGYNVNGTPEFWGLDKAARLRLWPAGSPLVLPGTFSYPVDQRWFASATWFDNEPVDGGTTILPKIYYHAGLDIGGAEGLVQVLAATEGVVVSSGLQVLEGEPEDNPIQPRYDVVYVRDARGWYYRYSHLKEIDESIVPGRVLTQGDRLGRLGKEGASGGWSHLHFEIKSRQPSGKWGTQAGYAILREVYLRQYQPRILACARPRHFLRAGESVTLDGSRSWSATGEPVRHEWTFHDGTTALGPTVTREYPQPGRYSEVLRVVDWQGNVDYDFAVVQVLDPAEPDRYAPSLHAAFAPSLDVRAGEPITFKVRAFRMSGGEEVWDFGDGSPRVTTQSDGEGPALNPEGYAVTTHTYEAPGQYLVRIERTNQRGVTATEHLHVMVGAPRE